MSFLMNIIWFIFGGFITALGWFLAGILCCITVIGIPIGMQCFKIAGFIMAPFGKDIVYGNFGTMNLLANVLWIIFLGWELAVTHVVSGAVLCITIVGIPFGLQHFKLASLALMPFGAKVD